MTMIVVPSGRRGLDRVRGDAADGARPVLDDHRLAEAVLHLVGDDAGDQVGGAAGGKADEQLHRPVDLVLGDGERAMQASAAQQSANAAARVAERMFIEVLLGSGGRRCCSRLPGQVYEKR